MNDYLKTCFMEQYRVFSELEKSSGAIERAAKIVLEALQGGKKVLICGNGGSAADSQHFAAELVGKFEKVGRKALPVLALTTNSSSITAWANDSSYAEVFERQVEAYGVEGDVLIAISTSGRSPNVIRATSKAKEIGMKVIALTGRYGLEYMVAGSIDCEIRVPSFITARMQEAHEFILHCIAGLVENSWVMEA